MIQEQNTWQQERRIHGMTNDEVKAQVRSGQRPSFSDPFANTAANKLISQRYAEASAAEFTQHMQTVFDWDSGDPNTEATKWLNGELEKYGSDPVMGQALANAFGSARSQVTEFGVNRANTQANEQRTDAAYIGMEKFLGDAIVSAQDPQTTAEAIYRAYDMMGTDGTLGVDYQALDAQLLTNAARVASSNPAYAEAILNAKGPEGMSFLENPRHLAKVELIQNDIKKAVWAQGHAAAMDQINGSNVQLLVNGGDLNGIREFVYTDVNGERKVVTPDQQRETALSMYGQLSDLRAKNYNETPQEQLIYDTAVLTKAGQLNPSLSDSLNGIAMQATPGTQLDPEAENQLASRLRTAIQVGASNPLILQTHVENAKDRDFIEAFQIGVGSLNMNDSEAIQFAGQVVNSPSVVLGATANEQLERELSAYEFSDWDWWWENDPEKRYTLGNTYAVEQRMENVARALVAANGMNPKKAVELAGQMTRQTFFTYRGQVLDLGGMAAPPDTKDAFNAYIENFAEANPEVMAERELTASDLTVIQRGSSFYVVNKDDFTFIPQDWNDANGTQGGKPRILSLQDLRDWSQWKASRLETDAAQSAANAVNQQDAESWTTYNHSRQPDIDQDAVAQGYSRTESGLYQDSSGAIFRPRAGMLGPVQWVRATP